MSVLILTGPPGAGKNTIAEILAKQREKCAVIDVDMVRWMILQPHKAPWDGEDGKKQQTLGMKNTISLTKNINDEGYDVVIVDVLTEEIVQLYQESLKPFIFAKIVLLLPNFEEVQKRNKQRPPRLKDEEIQILFKQQEDFGYYDERIENTTLSANDVVSIIRPMLFEKINAKENEIVIKELLKKYYLEERILYIEKSPKDWALTHGLQERSDHIALSPRRTNSDIRDIVIQEEISQRDIPSIISAIYARDNSRSFKEIKHLIGNDIRKFFIHTVLHEIGHMKGTDDDIATDNWAFNELANLNQEFIDKLKAT